MDEDVEGKLDELEGQVTGFKVITDSLKDKYKELSDSLDEKIPRIEKLEREHESLKTKIGKVSSRVDKLELSLFQGQIDKLSERMDAFSKEFSTKIQEYEHDLQQLQCYTCAAKVNEDLDIFCGLIEDSKLHNKVDLRTQIITDSVRAKAEIFTSKYPSRIAVDFHAKWTDYLRTVGISFINS